MARNDTFFLRTVLTSSGTTYVSDNIDISAYVDPSRGKCLVVDKAVISFSRTTGGPVRPGDVDAVIGDRSMATQACSEVQTDVVDLNNNSLFMKSNLYASNTVLDAGGAGVMGLMEQTDALNPAEFVSGFIIPTNQIHCGLGVPSNPGAWTGELDVGFLFEVHTEKLSLQRIQELLVSLTAN